jgi:hypothetical protein
MAVQTLPRPVSGSADTGTVALTDRGAAAVALLRFERLFGELGSTDRAYFAEELVELAREAEHTP